MDGSAVAIAKLSNSTRNGAVASSNATNQGRTAPSRSHRRAAIPGAATGQTPADPYRAVAASSSTSRAVTGVAMPYRRAARRTAPPIASSSMGRRASASRCMDDFISGGIRSNMPRMVAASTGSPAAVATAATSPTTASRSARRSSRTTPTGSPACVVTNAKGARKASLSQSRPASSARTVTSRPAPRSWSASASTRSRGAVSLATSIQENGLVWAICPTAVRVDSTRMAPATTCAGGYAARNAAMWSTPLSIGSTSASPSTSAGTPASAASRLVAFTATRHRSTGPASRGTAGAGTWNSPNCALRTLIPPEFSAAVVAGRATYTTGWPARVSTAPSRPPTPPGPTTATRHRGSTIALPSRQVLVAQVRPVHSVGTRLRASGRGSAMRGGMRRLLCVTAAALVVAAPAAVLTSSAPAVPAAPATSFVLLQMNLCNSGPARASCYTLGRSVDEAVGNIRRYRPELVTLQEICRSDLYARDGWGKLARAMADLYGSAHVAVDFAPAVNRYTDDSYRCVNGEAFGVAVMHHYARPDAHPGPDGRQDRTARE